MNKVNRRIIVAVIVILIVITVIALIFILYGRDRGNVVIISQNGEIIYTIDLSKENDRIITVEYHGSKNVIEIKNGNIHILDADCPDHICVNTGWLKNVPIVCLPNKLVIEYAN